MVGLFSFLLCFHFSPLGFMLTLFTFGLHLECTYITYMGFFLWNMFYPQRNIDLFSPVGMSYVIHLLTKHLPEQIPLGQ